MKYIALVTRPDGIRLYFDSLDQVLHYSIAGVKRKAGNRYSGRRPRDIPITYTSENHCVLIRLTTPQDAPYYEDWSRVNSIHIYPEWLAPAGAIPIKLIV